MATPRALAGGVATAPRATVLLAVRDDAVASHLAHFRSLVAHTTAAALQQIARAQPELLVLDLDASAIDSLQICRSCAGRATPTVLVITSDVERVPAALTAGCHGVLLKPFAPNLLIARLGRMAREREQQLRKSPAGMGPRATRPVGTNRLWNATACPHCSTTGAVSFEFASHRRMWYACLVCESVWLGARQE